jgi:hypothetical protein
VNQCLTLPLAAVEVPARPLLCRSFTGCDATVLALLLLLLVSWVLLHVAWASLNHFSEWSLCNVLF